MNPTTDHSSVELMVLQPADPENPVLQLLLAILVERGVFFAWEDGDQLPVDLPKDMSGVRGVVYDPDNENHTSGAIARKLARFKESQGFVAALDRDASPDAINGYAQVRWQAETLILSGGLTEQHPAMLERLAGRSDDQVFQSMWHQYQHRYRDDMIGWTDVQAWFWRALELLFELTDNALYLDEHAALIDESIEQVPNSAETINSYCGLQSVLVRYEATGDARYLDYTRTRLNKVVEGHYPSIDGVAVHNPLNDRFVWPEAIAMLCPAMAKMSEVTGDARYVEYAKQAIRKASAWMIDPEDGLWCHGGYPGRRVGHKWGRGNGWALYAIKETLRRLPVEDAFIEEAAGWLTHAAQGYAHYQDQKSGVWRNVVDHPDARLEMTASGMIVGTYAAALRHRWLETLWIAEMVESGWQGLKSKIWQGRGCTQVVGTGLAGNLQYYLERPQLISLARPTHLIIAYAEMQLWKKAMQERKKQ